MKKMQVILMVLGVAGMLHAAPQVPDLRPVQPKRSIKTACAPPPGFHRIAQAAGSFGEWLRNRPLKPAGSVVHLYDGRVKQDRGVYAGVLDLDIGTSDLQQCADAVMRLRAEYLFSNAQYDQIGFHFTNGFYADYRHWRDGCRVSVNGNATKWVRKGAQDGSYAQFRRYLETVFSFAGTRSLEQELRPVSIGSMQPGDVLIRGGAPGHAVLVMDMAVNAAGQKCYLLSQSYMPAQDIQILREPTKQLDGLWYLLPTDAGMIATPEWDFTTGQLKRFP
jgi:hypothetical protein